MRKKKIFHFLGTLKFPNKCMASGHLLVRAELSATHTYLKKFCMGLYRSYLAIMRITGRVPGLSSRYESWRWTSFLIKAFGWAFFEVGF